MSNRGTFLFSVEKCRFRTSRNTRSPSPGCGSPPDSLAYAASGKEVDVLLPKSTGNIAAILPLNVFRHEFETLSGVTTERAFPPNRLFRVLAPETLGWCEPHGWACCGGDSRRGHSRHKSRRVWSGSAATRKYDTRKTKSIPGCTFAERWNVAWTVGNQKVPPNWHSNRASASKHWKWLSGPAWRCLRLDISESCGSTGLTPPCRSSLLERPMSHRWQWKWALRNLEDSPANIGDYSGSCLPKRCAGYTLGETVRLCRESCEPIQGWL
jgi:hypothetical protein